ncbi:MAG: type I restriction enzyme HsdR N-terminal domain-containing protein [Catalinimonas sp.]
MMPPLNLPACNVALRDEDGKTWVLDVLRRKYVVLTPEEWVRQHFIQLLIGPGGYPRTLLRTEAGLHVNRQARRSDLLAYDRAGRPYLLVECKAPTVALAPQVFEQAARYNYTLRAPFLAVTNGMETRCWAFDGTTGRYAIQAQLPPFADSEL